MNTVRNFLRSPSGVVGLVIIGVLLLAALIAPIALAGYADERNIVDSYQGPSAAHWLGTDELGRDIFSRVLVAARLSLMLGVGALIISAAIGIPLGALSAVLGPRARSLLLRANDIMLGFPGIILGIYAGVVFGRGPLGPLIGIGIAGSFGYIRIASALALSIGSREFIQAARVVGVRGPRLLFRHVLPNVADTLIIATTVNISTAIVGISGLSFLGLGIQPPDYDWGTLLTSGIKMLYTNPASALGPAVAIVITALGFGFFGEALARAVNPLLSSKQVGRIKSVVRPGSDIPARMEELAGRMAATTAKPALDVQDLRVLFPDRAGGYAEIVKGVSFTVGRGQRVGIVGESGSGKTMTAMAIAQLVAYPGKVTGRVLVEGKDVLREPDGSVAPTGVAGDAPAVLTHDQLERYLSEQLAVVFQDPMTALNPALTIGTQLTEAMEQRKVKHGAAVDRAAGMLGEVQIAAARKQMDRYPHEFSGGMRQRALIAMGLMNEPRLLIADEPTTALDVTIQAQIMDLLQALTDEHEMAMVLISHNLGLIKQNCDRAIVMYAGRIVEEIPTDKLDDPLHPYTTALLSAVPDMTRSKDAPLATIPGQAPDPAAPPAGCAFHPRCPFAVERCKTEIPPLEVREDGRRVACWVANGEAVAPPAKEAVVG